jgi:hypothetical protein
MTIHYKIAGAWTQITRPYVKRSGAWTPVKEVWVKRSGTWTKSFEYDVTPPPPPLISVELVETKYTEVVSGKTVTRYGRYFKIGTRSSTGDDNDIKRFRVLSTYNGAAPTTQYGGTYTAAAASNYPNEPWSDWHFNGYGGSDPDKNTGTWRYKTWPRNATRASQLTAGTHYFTIWAEDLDGNWSAGNGIAFVVPKSVTDSVTAIKKDARFQPQYSGTLVSNAFSSGKLTQGTSPTRTGIWMYGGSFNIIGQQGTPDIRAAQIYIQRENDTGAATANVYLYWHEYTGPGGIPGAPVRKNVTKIGTIGKGESKWFDIPAVMVTAMENRTLKGFGLYHKDPAKASVFVEDYSVVQSIETSVRSGEVRVIWYETP